MPFGCFERRAGALGVAARLACMRDKAPVLGAQAAVAAGPGVGARSGALGLRVVALLQAHARELLPQARIARLDAQRALERCRGVGEPARGGIGAGAVAEAVPGGGVYTVAQPAMTTARKARRVLIGRLLSAHLRSFSKQALQPGLRLLRHLLDGGAHGGRARSALDRR